MDEILSNNDSTNIYSKVKEVWLNLVIENDWLDFVNEKDILDESSNKFNFYSIDESCFKSQTEVILKSIAQKSIALKIENVIEHFNLYVFNNKKDSFNSNVELFFRCLFMFRKCEFFLTSEFDDIRLKFFDFVLKSIQEELLVNNLESKILDCFMDDDVLSRYLSNEIRIKIDDLNKSSYVSNKKILNSLNEYVSRCDLLGSEANLIDKKIIIDVMLLERPNMELLVKEIFSNIRNKVIENDDSVKSLRKSLESEISKFGTRHFENKRDRYLSVRAELKKKLVSLALLSSLFLGIGVGANYCIKKLNTDTLYKTETTSYTQIQNEDIECKVVESYAPKVKYNNTLSIFSSTYTDITYEVEKKKSLIKLSLDNIEDASVETIFTFDEETLGVNTIQSKKVPSYDDMTKKPFRQIDFIRQDFEDSKEIFHNVSFSMFSSLLWIFILGISFIPRLPLNLLINLSKFLKNSYFLEKKEYEKFLRFCKEMLEDINAYLNKSEELQSLYEKFKEYDFDLLLDDELRKEFSDTILNGPSKNIANISDQIKKLNL